MNYRAAPKPTPPVTIRHRPVGPGMLALMTTIVVVISIVLFFSTLTTMRRVDVHCVRDPLREPTADGTCAIVETWPIFGVSSTELPIAGIHGTRITSSRSKNSTLYRVVLDTDKGEVPVSSSGDSSRALREMEQSELDVFLADRSQTRLDLEYDHPSNQWWMLFFMLIPMIGVTVMMAQARVTFDWSARTLTLVRTRWPLPRWSRTLSLDSVRAAALRARPGTKRTTIYTVVLELEGGEELPLLAGGSSVLALHEKTVAALNEQLARRELPA